MLEIRCRGFTLAVIAVVAAALVVPPGCGGKRAQRRAARRAQAAAQTAPPAALDPVRATDIRERALAVLEQTCRDPDPVIRANALEAIGLAPARAEMPLQAGLRDSNAAVRSVAAMVTGRARFERLRPTLQALLSDPSPFVRASAIYALGRTGEGADPTPLASMLFTDPSPRVRSHAVFVLGEVGDTSALPMIRQAAATEIPRASQIENRLFQLQAAEAMVKLGDEDRLEPIIAALFPASAEDLEATALAAQILGQLGHKKMVGDLNNLAGGTYMGGGKMPAEVRLAAAASLAKLGRPQNVAAIADEFRADQAHVLRAQSAMVYGELRDQSHLAKLESMLADGSGLVRVSAAAAILKITGSG